jgi:SPP1 family predicted phage head-tail adaptor
MYWRDIGYLLTETTTLDALRKPQKSFVERKVYVNEKGVKRQEFYQADVAGYRPELCLQIRASEYQNESHIRYYGTTYNILRHYPIENECVELICTGLVAKNE